MQRPEKTPFRVAHDLQGQQFWGEEKHWQQCCWELASQPNSASDTSPIDLRVYLLSHPNFWRMSIDWHWNGSCNSNMRAALTLIVQPCSLSLPVAKGTQAERACSHRHQEGYKLQAVKQLGPTMQKARPQPQMHRSHGWIVAVLLPADGWHATGVGKNVTLDFSCSVNDSPSAKLCRSCEDLHDSLHEDSLKIAAATLSALGHVWGESMWMGVGNLLL